MECMRCGLPNDATFSEIAIKSNEDSFASVAPHPAVVMLGSYSYNEPKSFIEL